MISVIVFDSRIHALKVKKEKTRAHRSVLKKRFGLFSMVLSLICFSVLVSPILSTELAYRFQQKFGKPNYPTVMAESPKEHFIHQPVQKFGILIPRLEIKADVIGSLNLATDDYFAALNGGVVHAKGTALPGQEGSVYIFGHSSDLPLGLTHSNSPFYSLGYSRIGDEITIGYGDKKFFYRVLEKKIVDPTAINYLTSSGKKLLILQTCWPVGTNWRRLLVIAQQVGGN